MLVPHWLDVVGSGYGARRISTVALKGQRTMRCCHLQQASVGFVQQTCRARSTPTVANQKEKQRNAAQVTTATTLNRAKRLYTRRGNTQLCRPP